MVTEGEGASWRAKNCGELTRGTEQISFCGTILFVYMYVEEDRYCISDQ